MTRACRSWSAGCVCTCMARVVLRSSRCGGDVRSGHRAVASSPNCVGVPSACTGMAHNPNTPPHASGNDCGLRYRSGRLRSARDSLTAHRHTLTWRRRRCGAHTLTHVLTCTQAAKERVAVRCVSVNRPTEETVKYRAHTADTHSHTHIRTHTHNAQDIIVIHITEQKISI